ncbi:MAG: hypothetical protein ACHQ9S_17120 [Candidatus Binatia bacterium]
MSGPRSTPLLLALVLGATVSRLPVALPADAVETVSLQPRTFAASSPAAPFQNVFSEGRRIAASTTPVWNRVDADLSAWGPALIFPLLDRSVPAESVLGLAGPLEEFAPAPALLFRTLGLYAAKSRLAFTDTPSLMEAISRNLGLIERAARDVDALAAGPELKEWGRLGVAAWIAYLELTYHDYGDLGDAGGTRWSAEGLRIVDELLVRGRFADSKGLGREPREERLNLWPTTLMMYALIKAYENEEAVKYESAAIAAAAAVDALRSEDGSYFSDPARARTDARANAYLGGALLLLSKDTGDSMYRERAVGILRWLTSKHGAEALAQDAALRAHVAYLVLLLDSLATQPYENVLGRRPMRVTAEDGAPVGKSVDDMAVRLRPPDFRHREMFDAVLHTLVERVPRVAGDFAYDYGDSPGYAASVLLSAGDTDIAPHIVKREEQLLFWPRPRDFDEIAFGTGALVAALDHPDVGDAAGAGAALRRYLMLSDGIALVDRYYLDWLDRLTNGGGYEYGPTVMGAQIAATHLDYAERFPDQKVGWWLRPLEVARALVAGADAAAWDPEHHVYRARSESDEIWLLPNAMMIVDLLRLYRFTGQREYLDRAEEVAAGLEPLWDNGRNAYFASSGQMGENGYESLSTNSYAALAFLRLYEMTQKPPYHGRALAVFDFISHDLYANGIIYHHLYRGRRAAGDVWCVGCNWRVLAELMELAKVN